MGVIGLEWTHKFWGKASTPATSRHLPDDVVMDRHLPDDVIMDILSRLRVKTLLRLKLVCKFWFSLISSPHFIRIHSRKTYNYFDYANHIAITYCQKRPIATFSFHSILPKPSYNIFQIESIGMPYAPKTIVGSCNGLICMVDISGELLLWNPSIRQFSRVLTDDYYTKALINCVNVCTRYGFYYDENSDSYKIVILENWIPLQPKNVTKLWSSKTNSWKNIQDRPNTAFLRTSLGVLLNGKLHWLLSYNNKAYKILSLDLESEMFMEFSTPDNEGNHLQHPILTIYKGFLSLVFQHLAQRKSSIYVMKEYGDISSWEEELVVRHVKCPWPWYRRRPSNSPVYTLPLGIFTNGEIILLNNKQFQEMGRMLSRVLSYEVPQITHKIWYGRDDFFYFQMPTSYVESLVSPCAVINIDQHAVGDPMAKAIDKGEFEFNW